MLNCIFHINGEMEVVHNLDKDKFLASGDWFDHPLKAKEAKEKLLDENVDKSIKSKKPVKNLKEDIDHEK